MLRVIAGKYRSRKLKDVKSDLTRPTTDKNKEALFNMIGQFFDGGRCLDLFAGSGALGIEALSRGFDGCDFVDINHQAIQVIKENIIALKIEEHHQIYKTDGLQFLKSVNQSYDLILIYPPYKLGIHQDILTLISSRQLLSKHGIIVMESDAKTIIQEQLDLVILKERVLGQSKLVILGRNES